MDHSKQIPNTNIACLRLVSIYQTGLSQTDITYHENVGVQTPDVLMKNGTDNNNIRCHKVAAWEATISALT
jgi:hypothetical protein